MNQRLKKKVVVAVSGGFSPVHAGHIQLFEEAKKLGDELVVILNNDNWLKKKKGFVFIDEKERKKIIESIKWVDRVVLTGHNPDPKDMSVCAELANLKPDIFANGGDRDKKDARQSMSSLNPEQALCKKLGIKTVFNVGGGKIQSSSWLLKRFLDNVKEA
jgi:D-beta-D-heptose 7-phosphate kinase/D-beta-D-heptose 1-phosphate adenosyltransferase